MIRTINELLSVLGKNIEDIQDPNVSFIYDQAEEIPLECLYMCW